MRRKTIRQDNEERKQKGKTLKIQPNSNEKCTQSIRTPKKLISHGSTISVNSFRSCCSYFFSFRLKPFHSFWLFFWSWPGQHCDRSQLNVRDHHQADTQHFHNFSSLSNAEMTVIEIFAGELLAFRDNHLHRRAAPHLSQLKPTTTTPFNTIDFPTYKLGRNHTGM